MAEITRMLLIESDGKPVTPDRLTQSLLTVELPLLKVLKDFTDSGWSFYRVTDNNSADIKKDGDIIRLSRFKQGDPAAFIPERDGHGE
jgi:hypothetical protein